MKIVADHTVPYLQGIAEPFAEVVYLPSEGFTPEAVKDADALIVRSIDKCTRKLLSGSRVRLITTATIGFDHIDTKYCDEAGIRWVNAPGCNAVSVGQYILSSLVAVALRKGESLAGKTLGIVGVGHVGKVVEQFAEAWGMRVLRNDPPRAEAEGSEAFVSLQTLAEEADIITLHVPFTREGRYATYHLADRSFFSRLKKRPWFINSCRGSVHDTAALLAAKENGLIGELILDCWENEPRIDRDLLTQTSLATPHIAGFSADGKANATRACLNNIAHFFGIEMEKINQIVPPPPVHPHIDLAAFPDHRLEHALLATFNPLPIDQALREAPEKFETFRTHYAHPRQFEAYTIQNATPEESALLRQLGFQ